MSSQTKPSSLKNPIFNIPNSLTAVRIFSVPAVVIFLYGNPDYWRCFWAAIVFGLAFWTDWFDGMIARRTQTITRLGKILDPMADKLIVLAATLMLIQLGRINVVLALILLGREVVISALRSLAGTEGIFIPSRWSGKTKTFIEGFALGFLMLTPDNRMLGIHWNSVGNVLLYVAVVFALWSATRYFLDYYRGTLPAA